MYILAVIGEGEMQTKGEVIEGRQEKRYPALWEISWIFSSLGRVVEAFISFSQSIIIGPVSGGGGAGDNV
jgi:hypothetical protein